MILLKQSHNDIHHRKSSLLFFCRFLLQKLPSCASLEERTKAQLCPWLSWFRGELQNQKKRERDKEADREKDRGKGTEREVILPFFCSPGWSLHPGPQRGTEYTSLLQWRGPTGAVAIWVCVWEWESVCVGGCSFKQAFEWPNCIGIQQSESWLRSRRAAGGVSARTSTATLSKRAPAQCTQLMLSLSLTRSPLFVLLYFPLILLLLTRISLSLSLVPPSPPSM